MVQREPSGQVSRPKLNHVALSRFNIYTDDLNDRFAFDQTQVLLSSGEILRARVAKRRKREERKKGGEVTGQRDKEAEETDRGEERRE